MNLALWTATALVALAALAALAGGVNKTFTPREKMATLPGAAWTKDAPAGLIRTLGALEFLAALGLALPRMLGIAPVLVPVTAAAFALLMVGAINTRCRYTGEAAYIAADTVLRALAVFIAAGRF
ncbi:DoxX family protein [Kitasatospora sp. NPDC101235]|uniref:DoxX family protein n=1 Tax=Kitasatospora sp. NPDC101235 TaxID=3364101 RepID=UPI00382E6575